jgi:Mg-chelatase subunit ChlD
MKTDRHLERRRGVVLILIAVLMVTLISLVALATDMGYLFVIRSDLQATADSAALAGASGLTYSQQEARLRATEYAGKNIVDGTPVALLPGDIEIGLWDAATHVFTPVSPSSQVAPHAVKVIAHRSQDHGTAVDLFFAKVFGKNTADVSASAVAVFGSRDIVVVLDYSGSMCTDSHFRTDPNPRVVRLAPSKIVANLRHVWEDLGSPTYGNMQFDPVRLTGTNTQIKRTLGLVDSNGHTIVPYPYPNHPNGWDGYINYVKTNTSDLVGTGYNYINWYGYLTLMNYWQTNTNSGSNKIDSYYMTPDLWKTREQPITAVKDGVTIFLAYMQQVETDDRVGLVSYSSYTDGDNGARLEVSLTTNFGLIETTSRHRQAGHYYDLTNIATGIETARTELRSRGRTGAFQMIVLLTDGVPNLSDWGDPKEAARRQARLANQEGIPILTISLGTAADTVLMQQIADLTGGIHFNVPGGDDVSDYEEQLMSVFAQIAAARPQRLVE